MVRKCQEACCSEHVDHMISGRWLEVELCYVQHDGHGYGQRARQGWDGPPHQGGPPNSAHRNYRHGNLAIPRPVASAGGSSTGGAMQSLGAVVRPRNSRPVAAPLAVPPPMPAAPEAGPAPLSAPHSGLGEILNLPTGPRRGQAPEASAATPAHLANGTLDVDDTADRASDAGPGADGLDPVVPERASGAPDQATLAAMVRSPAQGSAADAPDPWDEPAGAVSAGGRSGGTGAARGASVGRDSQVGACPTKG
jgi:hypothetical protein